MGLRCVFLSKSSVTESFAGQTKCVLKGPGFNHGFDRIGEGMNLGQNRLVASRCLAAPSIQRKERVLCQAIPHP